MSEKTIQSSQLYATPISGVKYRILTIWQISIATHPRPQPRPRLSKGHVYSNSKLVSIFKRDIADAIRRNEISCQPSKETPIYMEVEIGLPVKQKSKHGRLHVGKPDADNILKAIKDQIVNSEVIHDDSQICAVDMIKIYCQYPGYIKVRLSQLETIN